MNNQKNEREYYSKTELWGRGPDSYQLQVRHDIQELLPDDAESLLDIGCGDGLITNFLPKNVRVVGMDLSAAAIKHVDTHKLVGSVTDIPFPDDAFDVVMANDILEHLTDDLLELGVREIARVAKKYIIVTVPYRENIDGNMAKCADCGNAYHINMHHRVFDENKLLGLFSSPWKPSHFRYSGDIIFSFPDLLFDIRHGAGEWAVWDKTACPKCGSKQQTTISAENNIFLRMMDSAEYKPCDDMLSFSKYIPNRSEAIVLFSATDVKVADPAVKNSDMLNLEDILDVDFSNKLQAAFGGFSPWAFWPRFSVPENANLCGDGLAVDALETSVGVTVSFPITPDEGDIISAELSATNGSVISISVYDSVISKHVTLCEKELSEGKHSLECLFSDIITASRFGLMFSITVSGKVVLHRLKFVRKELNGPAHEAKILSVRQGSNVIAKEKNGVLFSWSFCSEHAGRLPFPEWFNCPDVDPTRGLTKLKRKVLAELFGGIRLAFECEKGFMMQGRRDLISLREHAEKREASLLSKIQILEKERDYLSEKTNKLVRRNFIERIFKRHE